MENAGLTFQWPLAVKLAGPFARAHDKGVVIKQKPLLWYSKGKRNPSPYGYISDIIESDMLSGGKDYHEWAQSPIEPDHVISRLTFENQIVVDPMMGSGTTGYAALKLNRKFIGIEKDPNSSVKAKLKLANWL
jgi:DNA modification methylase